MAAADKETQAKVNYRTGTPHKHCGLCEMFRPPSSCTAVKGPIKPMGVCDLFKRAFSRSDRWYGSK